MDERDKLIQELIKEKKGTKQDYLTLLDSIAYHESAGTMNPSIKQIGGGPGRGKYQFEVGKNAGGITAARRAKQYYTEKNIPVPEWLNEATSNDDLDVSNLSSEQQDVLFLSNMRKHPKADFSKLWEGKETMTDFWANYHWAGPNKDRSKKVNSFNKSLQSITPKSQKLPLKPYNPDVTKDTFKPVDDFSSFLNKKAKGGYLGTTSNESSLNSYNTGGTHEQNPHGGIPLGIGQNGKKNTVEMNETSTELDKGKFIFSNRIFI